MSFQSWWNRYFTSPSENDDDNDDENSSHPDEENPQDLDPSRASNNMESSSQDHSQQDPPGNRILDAPSDDCASPSFNNVEEPLTLSLDMDDDENISLPTMSSPSSSPTRDGLQLPQYENVETSTSPGAWHTDRFVFSCDSDEESIPELRFANLSMVESEESGITDTTEQTLESPRTDDTNSRPQQQRQVESSDKDILDEELTPEERQKLDKYTLSHFAWMPHGTTWTIALILISWMGSGLAIAARETSNFVTLDVPLLVDPRFDPVAELGLLKMEVCFNQTFVDMIASDGQGELNSGCHMVRLTSEDIEDRMFNLSRSFVSLAAAVGTFLSILVATSVYWQTINVKPIGVGFLLTYFFQSLSFLFFDSDLCRDNECRISMGSRMSVVASICWILTCLLCARMDALLSRRKAKLQRARQRKLRKLRMAAKGLYRHASTVTAKTATTNDSGRSRVSTMVDSTCYEC